MIKKVLLGTIGAIASAAVGAVGMMMYENKNRKNIAEEFLGIMDYNNIPELIEAINREVGYHEAQVLLKAVLAYQVDYISAKDSTRELIEMSITNLAIELEDGNYDYLYYLAKYSDDIEVQEELGEEQLALKCYTLDLIANFSHVDEISNYDPEELEFSFKAYLREMMKECNMRNASDDLEDTEDDNNVGEDETVKENQSEKENDGSPAEEAGVPDKENLEDHKDSEKEAESDSQLVEEALKDLADVAE